MHVWYGQIHQVFAEIWTIKVSMKKLDFVLESHVNFQQFVFGVWQITRRDEEMLPFIAGPKRNYIFGSICSVAANSFIKVCMPPSFHYNSYYLFIIRNVSLLNYWQAHYWLLGFAWYKIYQPIWGSTDMSQLHCTGAGWVSLSFFLSMTMPVPHYFCFLVKRSLVMLCS